MAGTLADDRKRMAFETEDPDFPGFRKLLVDSSDWETAEGLTLFGSPVKVNPSGDVWEARLPN